MNSSADPLPGYYVDPLSKAWSTLPWPGDRSLPYSHPERMALLRPSIGLQVIRWAQENLVHHLTGEPWRFTPGQARFFMLWYSVDVETGRWIYRRGAKRGSKGTGKDPILAAWAECELMGPTRIHDIDGQRVIGAPHRLSLVQVGANSEAQAADVLRVANAMVPEATRAAYGYDAGTLRSQLDNGSRFELLTNSEASTEGDPPTAAGLNETHHMKESNGGHKIASVVRRNVGKSPRMTQARMLDFTNGHEEGEDSIAERTFLAWQAQQKPSAKRRDILYDSIEAVPGVDIYDDASRREGLRAAYSDAPWADLERLEDEVLDPETGVSKALRFYFNIIAANEEAWVEPRKWDDMADATVIVADREPVALFLDCSKTSDATALIGCRISDGHVFVLGIWQRPPGKRGETWTVPRHEVDAKVDEAFERYRVVWFGVDPSPAREDTSEAEYWAPLVDSWHQKYRRRLKVWATPGAKGHAVKFDMRTTTPGGYDRNRLLVEMAQETAAIIDDTDYEDADGRMVPAPEKFTHDGDPTLRLHVHHARIYPTKWGTSLGKVNRDSRDLVDGAVAMVGARLGRQIVLNSGKVRKSTSPDRVKHKARAVRFR